MKSETKKTQPETKKTKPEIRNSKLESRNTKPEAEAGHEDQGQAVQDLLQFLKVQTKAIDLF